MEIPYSQAFDDIYYSSDGGIAETQFVFIESNQILERWSLSKDPIFTICETGFGTGLNFLYTWKLWEEFQNKHNTFSDEESDSTSQKRESKINSLRWLHFISTEAFPLSGSDIYKYLHGIPEISEQLKIFLAKYNLYSPAFYRFIFPESRITLTLLYGDINNTLPELVASVDAWYLDGFAPSKNPEMWSDTVFQEMARLSHLGTSFATYTSSSVVRKGLKSAGFHVQKKNGFGKKREMCFGYYHTKEESTTLDSEFNSQHLWKNEFSIAGAGVSGASLAFAFKQRSIPVTVYDPIGIAEEASGNPVGIFYPHLSKFPTSASQFSLASFYYADQLLSSLDSSQKEKIISQEGLLFKINSEEKANRYKKSLESHSLPEKIAKLTKHESLGECIFFAKARSLDPKSYVNYLLTNVKFINKILPDQSVDKSLELNSNKYLKKPNNLVYCNSYHLKNKESTQELPIKKVRGQLYYSDDNDPIFPFLNSFAYPISSDSYMAKDTKNRFILGSTFDEFKTERAWSEQDEETILQRAMELIEHPSPPNFMEIIEERKSRFIEYNKIKNQDSIESNLYRISHRSQSKDRNPIIGNHNGTWVMTALGSRGLVTSLLGGEILASLILKEPVPVPKSILQSLSPVRFSKKKSIALIQE